MEFLLVLALLTPLLVIVSGKLLWLWIALLIFALGLGFRAYRIRCPHCRRRVIGGAGMRFCNQCGAEQRSDRRFIFRCGDCRRMARSELNLNFCNRCGTAVPTA